MRDSRAGDIVYTRALGQEIIILNSEELAIALLEKRSDKYSDRPVYSVAELYVVPPFLCTVTDLFTNSDSAGNGHRFLRGMDRGSSYTDDCYISSFMLKQH